jgi:uncharacterized YccA/Bax inhibitor family protein
MGRMSERTQRLVIVFVVAVIAVAFFLLVLDLPAFVAGALGGVVAVLVAGAVQRRRVPPR